MAYCNCIDVLASEEVRVTGEVIHSSLGWHLLLDGNTKGSYRTKALFVYVGWVCTISWLYF